MASVVGNAMEWYDFFLYGNAAALVFGRVLLPKDTYPLAATLIAFAGFAAGFLARPIGAVVFGTIGDLVGRRTAMMATLLLMGSATFLIGVLPTFSQVGYVAPFALLGLRILQGVAAGGEWSGGVLIISEAAGDHNRGFLSAWSQVGVGAGLVLASAGFYSVTLMPEAQFYAWGWRLPFLASVLIFGVGAYIRLRLPESQAFARLSRPKRRTVRSLPALEALRRYPKEIAIGVGLRLAENGGIYIFTAFAIAYGSFIGVSTSQLLLGVTLATAAETGAMLAYGALSDRIGRAPVYMFGAFAMIVLSYPFFLMLGSGHAVLVVLAFVLTIPLCHAAMIGVQPSFLHELFPVHIRYSCVGLSHEIGSVVAGGISPLVSTALLAASGAIWPVVVYLATLGLVTMGSVIVADRRLRRA